MLIALTIRVMLMKIEAITVVPMLNIPRLPVRAPLTRLKSMIKAVARRITPRARIPQDVYRIPGSTSLTSISHTNNILTISGQAPSEKEVLAYFKNLNDSGRFANITISNMTNIEGEGMDFTIISSIITSNDESGSLVVVMSN